MSSRYWGDDPNKACAYANVTDQTINTDDISWHKKHECMDEYFYTAPVGKFKPNNFGLYDMLGNVWEWCADWYEMDYYKGSPKQNPQGSGSGSERVFRGGSWSSKPSRVRSSYRGMSWPSSRTINIGFRLVSPSR